MAICNDGKYIKIVTAREPATVAVSPIDDALGMPCTPDDR